MEGLRDEARICIFRIEDFTMQKFTLRQRLYYRFENTLASGTGAVITWLAVLSLLIILLAATLIYVFDIPAAPDDPTSWGFCEGLWNSLMRTLDAGNMADDAGWMLRIVTLFVTIGGIFIVATLIGSIGAGFEGAIEELRKGKSVVIESGHTIILGWSPKIFRVISELVIANANHRRPRIVVMADKDKVEMEDEIRQKVPDTGNTRIICRTGSTIDVDDLRLISMNEAKSIIILSRKTPHFQTPGRSNPSSPSPTTPRGGKSPSTSSPNYGTPATSKPPNSSEAMSSACCPPRISSPKSQSRPAGSRASPCSTPSCSTSKGQRFTCPKRPH